jgi:hypothetical protein
MKLKWIWTLLVIFFFGVAAGASETTPATAEEKLFFEPTQADFDASWKEIGQQDKLHKAAKKSGNYGEARRLAMFHIQLAWLWHNEALAIIMTKAGWCDKAELQRALDLWEKAETEIGNAVAKNSHVDGPKGAKACSALVARNSVLAKKQIEALEAGKGNCK